MPRSGRIGDVRALLPAVAVLLLPAAAPAQIVGGAETSEFPATVALIDIVDADTGAAIRFCSGTLIRPDVVLTAAHCFQQGEPDLVYFGTDPFVADSGFFVDGASYLEHPSWDGDVEEWPAYDIALVFLGTDVTTVDPIQERTDNLAVLVSTSVTFVGFGATESDADNTTKRVGVSDVDEAIDDILLTSLGPGGPCFGDSGGTAYTGSTPSSYRVAAVSSFVTSANCTDSAGSTRTDLYAGWIEDEAGPWIPPGDDDDDDDADNDDDGANNEIGDGTTTLGALQEDRGAGCRSSAAGTGPGTGTGTGTLVLVVLGLWLRRAR